LTRQRDRAKTPHTKAAADRKLAEAHRYLRREDVRLQAFESLPVDAIPEQKGTP
jgi:hypothetical protein